MPKNPINFSPPKQQQQINFKQAKNFFSLGKVLAKKGEWKEAIAAYRKAVELAPEWKEARQRLEDAENQLQEKTVNTQQQTEASRKLTIIDVPLGKTSDTEEKQESAIITTNQTIIVSSNLADDYQTNGDILVKKGEKEEAIKAYRKAIEINPELWEVHHKLGNLLQEKGELEAAVTTYKKSIELKSDFCWSHNNLADILVRLGKWQEAIVSYQKAIELEPNFPWSHYNLAELCLQLSEWDKAVEAYRQFMQIQPDFSPKVEEKLNQALHQQVKERLEQALSYYRQAIENDPMDVESYQKALEIKPDDVELYLGLGNALYQKSEYQKAMNAYQRVLQIRPDLIELEENAIVFEKCRKVLKMKSSELEKNSTENRPDHEIFTEQKPEVRNQEEETTMKVLLISVLFFYAEERSLHFLDHVPSLVISKCQQLGVKPVFVFRNNSFNFDSRNLLEKIESIRSQFPEITLIYTEGVNLGFGGGHNYNFKQHESDIFIVLNDDIGLPHFDAIETAIVQFTKDMKLAAIGSYKTPTHIQEDFGYVPDKEDEFKVRDYAEASILFLRSSVFHKVNGFDEKMEYAYFEDSDLSLRLKQAGYKFIHIDIPHQHFRSTSALKIPEVAARTVYEYNRTRFLSRWSNYLKHRKLKGKVLVALLGDGIGDLVDCYYPVAELVQEHLNRGVKVELILAKNKLNFLYESLPVKIINQDAVPIGIDREYDQVYQVDDINYSPPFHTLDLIAAKLGITDFSDDEKMINNHVINLEKSEYILNIPHLQDGNYAVAHLDSQRGGFEGRSPILKECIPALNSIAEKYPVLLIGLHHPDEHKDSEYEAFISNHNNIFDLRNQGTIQDSAYVISKAKLFFGLDSGPMHFAQLFNIPSFIMYGPIHPLTKIYRYNNSGAVYNTEGISGSGYYHKYIEPGYYFCMRRDEQCIKFIEGESLRKKLDDFISKGFKFDWNELFSPLRYRQREWLFLQYHNPLFKNRLLEKNLLSSKGISDLIIQVCEVFENRAKDTINHHVSQSLLQANELENENNQLKEIIKEMQEKIKKS